MSVYHSVNHESAANYAGLGYKVFPLKPGDKKPEGRLAPNGVNDATTDLAVIERWWKAEPNCGVGLSCEGLLVVDQDGPTGKAWLSESPDLQAELAESPVRALTPSDGWHTIYRQPPGSDWRNTTGKLAPKVDTRANGGYIVVYPTVLEPYSKDGKDYPGGQYKWLECQELDISPDKLPLPPAWLWEMVEWTSGRTNKSDLPPFDPSAPKRELTRDETREVYGSLPLYVNRFSQKFAFKELIRVGWQFHSGPHRNGEVRLTRPGKNPKDGCSASWNSPEAYDRKWGTPRLHTYSTSDDMGDWEADKSYSPFDIISITNPECFPAIEFEMERTLVELEGIWDDEDGEEARDAGGDDDGPPPDDLDDGDDSEQVNHDCDPPAQDEPPKASESSGGKSESEAQPDKDPNPTNCPYWDIVSQCRKNGFIQLLWDEMVRQEWVPQPAFRLAAALVVGAAMLGRKARTGCGETPALTVIAIGGSGTGKNTSKSLVQKLLMSMPVPPAADNASDTKFPETQVDGLYGVAEGLPHSDSGLHAALHANPALVNIVDEMGSLFEAGELNRNGFQGAMLAAYTELMTVGLGYITPRPKAKREESLCPIWAPVGIVLGYSQPEKVGSIINREHIETGLTSRSIIFEADSTMLKRTDRNQGASIQDVSRELVDTVNCWRLWNPRVPNEAGVLRPSSFTPWQFDCEAMGLLAEIDARYDRKRVEAIKRSGLEAYLYTRAAQNIKRLALVFHMDRLGTPPEDPRSTITKQDVVLAEKTVGISMRFMLKRLGLMADSKIGDTGNRIVNWLKARKESFPNGKDPGATREEIRKAIRNRILDGKRGFEDIDEYIGGSEDSPVVIKTTKPRGKEVHRYFHR